jgi:CHAT domain-containing protein/tetratricopeptide (TPR) repeat protein
MSFWKRFLDRNPGKQVASLFQQAVQLYQQSRDTVQVASLNRQVLRLHRQGRYEQAMPIAEKVCNLARQVLGEHHPRYAANLNNLGLLYSKMGKYAAAEPFYHQALEIRRKALGEGHPDYAQSLNNMGEFYRDMGDYAAAEPLLRQTVEILRGIHSQHNPNYGHSLNNLAELHAVMGNYAAAEPRYRQAIEMLGKALGQDHPDYATILNNLAELYCEMHDYAAAEPLLHQSLKIRRQALGEGHLDYAASLNNLAALYYGIGNYAAAEPLLHQSLEILRKELGEHHPKCAESLGNLAFLYVPTGRGDEALVLLQKAATIDDRIVGQIFSIGSESQRMAYLATLQGHRNALLSLIIRYSPHSPKTVQEGLEFVLRRKALGAEALAAQRDAVLGGRYPGLQPKLQELVTWRRQIAQKTLAGPGPEGPAAHQKLLAEWTVRKERLEEELVQQVPEMNLEQRLRVANRRAIAQALPAGSVLVEFIRFTECNFAAVWARGESPRKPARYLAFVLPSGEPDNVQMLDLGEAEPIERMIAGFRASITGGERSLRPNEPLPSTGTNDGSDLRRAVFDPLVPALGGCTRLFLAPDGDMTRLPFEALPTDAGRRLIDDYRLSYLGAGRDVLRFEAKPPGQRANPVVVADPDFDLGMTGTPMSPDETKPQWRQSRALDPSALHFDPLPGTHTEGEHIAARLDVRPWLKSTALEGRLKAFPSPRIVHIATHGFFLEDQKGDPSLGQLGLGRLSHALENPLLRSGLALAGANTWLQEKPLPAEAEDGILTAEDVSGLDLLNTELVVLSACETGLGAVQVGEGVFGLRRAFVLAGAHTLVMSLWKVPDRQTQELMEDFYARILAGEGRAEALREAQLAMKEKYPEPLYWGAFICQGDPGPLLGRGA